MKSCKKIGCWNLAQGSEDYCATCTEQEPSQRYKGPSGTSGDHSLESCRQKHGHYFRDVQHLTHVDVYRILDLYEVTHPCLQHALKKVLCAGIRGAKNAEQDVIEAIDSLQRWLDMRIEDAGVC